MTSPLEPPTPELADRFAVLADAVRATFPELPCASRWTLDRVEWPTVEWATGATRIIFALEPASHGEGWIVTLHAQDAADRAGRGRRPVDLGDLQEWQAPHQSPAELEAVVGRTRFWAGDDASTRASVQLLGELLRGPFAALLEDDETTMAAVRVDAARRNLAAKLDHVRPDVEARFRREDWAGVVRRLEPFGPALRRSEKLKLAYARKRL